MTNGLIQLQAYSKIWGNLTTDEKRRIAMANPKLYELLEKKGNPGNKRRKIIYGLNQLFGSKD